MTERLLRIPSGGDAVGASIAVVGGGLAGLALAHFLAERGADEIVVVEQADLGSGVTAASLGGVRQQFSKPLEVELAKRSLAFWQSAEERFEHPCEFHRDGYLFVTGQEERMQQLADAADVQRAAGAGPVETLAAAELRDVAPWLDVDGLLGGTWTPHDGRVNASDGVAGLAAACRRRGVRIFAHDPVSEIARAGSGWRLTAKRRAYAAEQVVVAAGLGTPRLLAPLGFDLAIVPFHLPYAITEPALPGLTVPLTIDFDSGLCVEREGDGLAITVLDRSAGKAYSSTEMLDAFAEAASVRASALISLGIRTTFSGDADMTADGRAYAGRLDDGLWAFAGFAGHGVVHAPPIAEQLAAVIAGAEPEYDLSPFDPTRDPSASEPEWMEGAKRSAAA